MDRIRQRDVTSGQQRTNEWLNIKKHFVGGTSISDWINSGHPINCMAKQLIGSSFRGNHSTRWGTIFEDAANKITELLLNVKHYHVGFVTHPNIIGLGCSPDGIIPLFYKDALRLFAVEYKSPIKSLAQGFVPKHYENQVQLELATLPECDELIFINNVFRKCSLDQFRDTDEIDLKSHDHTDGQPMAMGIAEIYLTKKTLTPSTTNETEETKKDMSFSNDVSFSNNFVDMSLIDLLKKKYAKDEIIDFGDENIEDLFLLISKGYLEIRFDITKVVPQRYKTTSFLKEVVKQSDVDVDKLFESCKEQIGEAEEDNKVVGILPWKLMQSDFILVDRDTRFMPKVSRVKSFMLVLQRVYDKIKGISDEKEYLTTMEKVIKDMYPNCDLPEIREALSEKNTIKMSIL